MKQSAADAKRADREGHEFHSCRFKTHELKRLQPLGFARLR